MPRKYLKRWSPHPDTVRRTRGLEFLERFLRDPNLFHINRHSVARGVFVGFLVAWMPLPGQLPISGVLAIAARGNLPIAMLLTCLNNPFTFPLALMLIYRTGAWLMGSAAPDFHFELTWEFARTALPLYWRPLALGSISLGLTTGLLGALLSQLLWRLYVVNRLRHRRIRAQQRHQREVDAGNTGVTRPPH